MVGRDDAMFRRSHALTRCAIAALAAERYRRANGRWPESLAELVTAGLLRAVPGDSFDGQPLRLKPTDNGLIIYSADDDWTDGGVVVGRRRRSEHIVSFRLWDPAARRQPQPPP